MEEVWKEINLSSFQPYSSSSSSHSLSHSSRSDDLSLSNSRGMNLQQDYLDGPFFSNNNHHHEHHPFFPTTTVSAGDNNFLIGSPPNPTIPLQQHHLSLNLQQQAFGKKKRMAESDNNNIGGDDRQHKRMIKNRESACRSRVRKQAYTNELEIEVQNLKEENAKLKREQQKSHVEPLPTQLCMAAAVAAAPQLSKKHTLHRTSTAPF